MRKFGSPASRWRHLPAYALLLGLCGAIWWYSLLSRSHSAVTTPNGLSGQAYRRGPGDFLGIHAAAPAKQEELAKLKVLAVIGVQVPTHYCLFCQLLFKYMKRRQGGELSLGIQS